MKKMEAFQSGRYVRQFEYKSFSPTLINEQWYWEDPEINVLLEQANCALSALNAYTQFVPDVDRFIYMHIAREANTSSRIEGTKTEIDEAILPEDAVVAEKRDDWQEVQNYIRAMNYALEQLRTLPLSIRLLKETHRILMSGVRGEHKCPGEIRHSQNWIGGNNLKEASYIPPHHEELPELLTDLEMFWHNDQIFVPHLIRCAITHYQFETIHPFCDGNGRVGRLLIPLYLISNGVLSKPSLYMSAYLEKNRSEYYSALDAVRKSNHLIGWCKFFLRMLIQTAENGRDTFIRIQELKEEMQKVALDMQKRSGNTLKLLDILYQMPVIDISSAAKALDVSFPAASGLIHDLVDHGVLIQSQKISRPKIFIFSKYMNIFTDEPANTNKEQGND